MDGRMLGVLRSEAHALAQLAAHHDHGAWSINADAGTVIDLRDQSLVVFLHQVTLDPIPGVWFFPHDKGTT